LQFDKTKYKKKKCDYFLVLILWTRFDCWTFFLKEEVIHHP